MAGAVLSQSLTSLHPQGVTVTTNPHPPARTLRERGMTLVMWKFWVLGLLVTAAYPRLSWQIQEAGKRRAGRQKGGSMFTGWSLVSPPRKAELGGFHVPVNFSHWPQWFTRSEHIYTAYAHCIRAYNVWAGIPVHVYTCACYYSKDCPWKADHQLHPGDRVCINPTKSKTTESETLSVWNKVSSSCSSARVAHLGRRWALSKELMLWKSWCQGNLL